MHNDIQTAANSKNHAGDAPVQISAAQIERLKRAYIKAGRVTEWALMSNAEGDYCTWWISRRDTLHQVLAELGIEAPGEI